MPVIHVALVPRDGLFCKDGRGWHTSASGRGHALDWPWPSTVLGALRTAWGRAEETRNRLRFGAGEWRARMGAVRIGRTLVLRRGHGEQWNAAHTIWPVPRDALWLHGRAEVHRLEPAKPLVPTLGRDDDDARERLMRPALDDAGKPLVPPRWWTSEDFAGWLAERTVFVRATDPLAPTRRLQVRVGILPEQLTADEGVLFSHDVLETLERAGEWAVGVEVAYPEGDLPTVATLGSDSRLVRVEPISGDLFEAPADVLSAFRAGCPGLRIVTVTPVSFARGWLPDGLDAKGGYYRGRVPGLDAEVILRAACVSRPIHVSGWDMAAGAPKPTSRMVAPGAVYFFERVDGQPFGEGDARALWLAALGMRADEGFGRVVPGVWNPIRSS
jgi:CRISPR-associated protein Cmr3